MESLEYTSLPSTVNSKHPPLEGSSVNEATLFFSELSNFSAKLAA
ncbi:MAG: hypothetical protein NXI22_17045 [bacterium]|nr:hypothetical protein [bacterium]